MKNLTTFYIGLLVTILLTAACQTQPQQIFIEVDGGRQSLVTEETTVRGALEAADVVLESQDKVKPDLYVQLEPGMVIVVTRVTQNVETERNIIPFEKQTIVNEALAPGDTRLAQLGVNGEEEVSVRVVYEDGKEVSRTEVSRVVVVSPIPEILVVGPEDELPSTKFEGTIAYLSNGNAWLMRESSGSRRALTTEGNLDNRVFSLSPNGHNLIYTQKLTDDLDMPLNELWMMSTTIVGEDPITVGLQGVLNAQWSPVVTESLIAYSTAERTASVPGWRANNDLWLLDLAGFFSSEKSKKSAKPVKIIDTNTQGLYPWWGTTFTWSPDGTKLAYARADQIGVIQLTFSNTITANVTPLVDFVPLETFSEWVWIPGISWSPDSSFIAATVHGSSVASEPPEESQVFDLWLLSIDGTISAMVAENVGMWANPAWGQDGIAFGRSDNPLQSVNSHYTIQLVDRDGSNQRQIFPFQNEVGVAFPELVWSPDNSMLLFVNKGDLHITSSQGSPPRQLTTNTQAAQPNWINRRLLITDTAIVTASNSITVSKIITPTPVIAATVTPTLTLTPSAESSTTITSTFDIERTKD